MTKTKIFIIQLKKQVKNLFFLRDYVLSRQEILDLFKSISVTVRTVNRMIIKNTTSFFILESSR